MEKKEKYIPKVGEPCYLRQFTGSYYVDMVKRPYTVVAVTPTEITLQACKMTPPVYHCCGNPNLDRPELEGQRIWFYDTVAETIEPNPEGSLEVLTWHGRKGLWGLKGYKDSEYPEYAIFGKGYMHQPYLD